MTTSGVLDLSLVIPCYGDAPHLAAHTDVVIGVLDQTRLDYEIIFVDDGSPDRCCDVIDEILPKYPDYRLRKIVHEKNKGRGAAVRSGILAADGEITGFIDIDLEMHALYIPTLVAALQRGECDVAVGHRIYRLQPSVLHRAILSKGYRAMVNRLFRVRMADTESGFKFFNRERILPVLESVEDSGWFWDTEIMLRSHYAGLRIGFFPGLFIRKREKQSTVRLFSTTTGYFRKLWAFRKVARKLRADARATAATGGGGSRTDSAPTQQLR